MPVMTSDDGHGNATGLLTEAQLRKLCDIMYTCAKQVGYGLRTYNKEITSTTGSGGPLNIHELALMLRSMPAGMDHLLAYALISFQAFTVGVHVIHSYVSWRDYITRDPYYKWSNDIIQELEVTTLAFLEHHLEAILKPQREGGSSFVIQRTSVESVGR